MYIYIYIYIYCAIKEQKRETSIMGYIGLRVRDNAKWKLL